MLKKENTLNNNDDTERVNLEIKYTEAAAFVCCDTLLFSTRLHSSSQADILVGY